MKTTAYLINLALYLCALLALTGCSDGSDSGIAVVSFADEPGALAVGRRTDVMLRDEARGRDITATYWYPAAGPNAGALAAEEDAALVAGDATFPLVILIHGLSDNAGGWNYLAPHLASHGYIVMAPSTGSSAETGADLFNHPGDASFLIDTSLGENSVDPMFAGRVEAEDIFVGGFSFGGFATYILAYNDGYQDDRVSGVMTIAPATSTAEPFNPDLTLLVIQGTEDPLVPFDATLNFYEAANAPKYFVSLQGAGHVPFTGSVSSMGAGTMDDLRAKSITRQTVLAFLTSLFADSAADRAAGRAFLQDMLDAENGDVTVMFE